SLAERQVVLVGAPRIRVPFDGDLDRHPAAHVIRIALEHRTLVLSNGGHVVIKAHVSKRTLRIQLLERFPLEDLVFRERPRGRRWRRRWWWWRRRWWRWCNSRRRWRRRLWRLRRHFLRASRYHYHHRHHDGSQRHAAQTHRGVLPERERILLRERGPRRAYRAICAVSIKDS